MNLILAIREMEAAIWVTARKYDREIEELREGLRALRKLNTVCERCGGEGRYLRRMTCAEDSRPDPDNPDDYVRCVDCKGTGRTNGAT